MRYFLLLIFFTVFSSFIKAQLDVIHYIPPISGKGGINQQVLYITTPSETPVNYTIKAGDGTVLETNTVVKDIPIKKKKILVVPRKSDNVQDSYFHVLDDNNAKPLTGYGLIIEADEPIYVNLRCIATGVAQAGSLTSKGSAAIGKRFRLGAMPNYSTSVAKASTFGIMAVEDNTNITVDFNGKTVNLVGMGNVNAPINIKLNKGETWVGQLISTYASNASGMIGALVESDRGIVVNSGSMLGGHFVNNTNNQPRDIGIDQIVGSDKVGTDYVIVKGNSGSQDMESLIIVADHDDTKIYVSGSANPIRTINAGQFYHVKSNDLIQNQTLYVRTSKPAFAYQLIMGAGIENTPGMNFIPAWVCSANRDPIVIANVKEIGTKEDYRGAVFIIAELDAVLELYEDGVLKDISNSKITVKGKDDVDVYRVTGLKGNIEVYCDQIAQIGFFGSSGYAGYGGYFAGFSASSALVDYEVIHDGCGAGTGSIKAIPLEGIRPYTYKWSNGSTDSVITNLTPGFYKVVAREAGGCEDSIEVEVKGSSAPSVYFEEVVNVSCFEKSDGYVKIAGVDVTDPDYEITWIPSGSGDELSDIDVGTYSVTVNYKGICDTTIDTAIIQPEALVLNDFGGTICKGECIDLYATLTGGTPPYSWKWNGAVSDSIYNVCPDEDVVHEVSAEDANNCPISDTVLVKVKAVILDTAITHDACEQNKGTIDVTPSGGTEPYSFEWNNGKTESKLENLAAGNYDVIVTDKLDCAASLEVTIKTTPTPNAAFVEVKNITCFGDNNGSIKINVEDSLNIFDVNWIPSGNGLESRSLSPGTYTITVSYLDVCEYSIDTLITEPEELIVTTFDTALCVNECVDLVPEMQGGTKPYTWEWENGETNTTQTVCPSQETNYPVEVTDDNGCVKTGAFLVQVGDSLKLNVWQDTSICVGEKVTLRATATGAEPIQYLWDVVDSSQPTISVSPDQTTDYTITATDNCDNTLSKSVKVTILPLPIVEFEGDEGCAPLNAHLKFLQPDNAVSWFWDFGNGYFSNTGPDGLHTYDKSGNYDVTLKVTDDKGCIGETTLINAVSVYANPSAAFETLPSKTTIYQPKVRFKNQSSENAIFYNWTFDELGVSDKENPSFEFTEEGAYEVILKVETEHGCKAEISDSVYVEGEFSIYIPNAFTPHKKDGVNDYFPPKYINIDADEFQLMVFNRWGELIFITTNPNEQWNGRKFNNLEMAQIDTYVWKMKGKSIYGHKFNWVGKVTLIK